MQIGREIDVVYVRPAHRRVPTLEPEREAAPKRDAAPMREPEREREREREGVPA